MDNLNSNLGLIGPVVWILDASVYPAVIISSIQYNFRRSNIHTGNIWELHFILIIEIFGPLYRKLGKTLIVKITDLQKYVLGIMSSFLSVYLDQ